MFALRSFVSPAFIVFGRVQIQIQTFVVRDASGLLGRSPGQKLLQVRGPGLAQFEKSARFRQNSRDSFDSPLNKGWQIFRRMGRGKIHQGAQRLLAQVRLIAQRDHPVCQVDLPSRPTAAAQRTELNIPSSGAGFGMKFSRANARRTNS